jgi:hypothetical protein
MTYALLDMEAHRLIAVDVSASQLEGLSSTLEPHVAVADVPTAHKIIDAWAHAPAPVAESLDFAEAVRSRI